MADDAGQPRSDLSDPFAGRALEWDLFELLRRLEADGRRFGRSGSPRDEPARLGQGVRLGFAVSDVLGYEPAGDGRPARVANAAFGLLGPEGPMPLHLTRWVLDRLSQRWFADGAPRETSDTTFLDFANVLQHRMTALFYRAWADAHPAVQGERPEGGRLSAMLAALGGVGLPGTRRPEMAAIDAVRIRQATSLARQTESPDRLTHFLRDLLEVPVRVREFVPTWLSIPAGLQSRLGRVHAALGRGAVVGRRIFQPQTRIELRMGPLDLATYERLLPGGASFGLMRTAVRDLCGDALDVDVRLVLAARAVPPARLGAARLGRTTWLARRPSRPDAEDMRIRAVAGLGGQLAGRAAA